MVERAFERVPRRAAVRRHRHPDDADQHRLPAARRRGLGGARRRAADRARARPARAAGCAASSPTSAPNASTTGLLDARSGEWADELIERLGLPARLFGALVEPGTALGPLLAHHELGDAPVYAVASHDTASAFVAAPLRDEHAAVLSSGTWSLLGLELRRAGARRRRARRNLTNERGDRRHDAAAQERDGAVAAAGVRAACWDDTATTSCTGSRRRRNRTFRCSTPTTRSFLRPGDMPARIAAACERTGQPRAGRRRRDRPQHPRLAGLQVPLRARAARGGHAAATCARST